MRAVGQAGSHMQRALGQRHVVDIVGLAGHMLVGGIVLEVAVDAAGAFFLADIDIDLVHARPPAVKRTSSASSPWLSRKKRRMRFFPLIMRYSAEARQSVSGLKSPSS